MEDETPQVDNEKPQDPILVADIPDLHITQLSPFGPFDLNDYIASPNDEENISFFAELEGGAALIDGMICTTDGDISGIPAKGTSGTYKVNVYAENSTGNPLAASFTLVIHESLKAIQTDEFTLKKEKVWEALKEGLDIPEVGDITNRPITINDIRYIMEKITPLIIWNVFDVNAPSEKTILQIEGLNEHYNIYDCGSCLVGTPKELYSTERTTKDQYDMAKSLAREAHNRDWTVEFAGLEKPIRIAWTEIKLRDHITGKQTNIIDHTASEKDIGVYEKIVETIINKENPAQNQS